MFRSWKRKDLRNAISFTDRNRCLGASSDPRMERLSSLSVSLPHISFVSLLVSDFNLSTVVRIPCGGAIPEVVFRSSKIASTRAYPSAKASLTSTKSASGNESLMYACAVVISFAEVLAVFQKFFVSSSILFCKAFSVNLRLRSCLFSSSPGS